MEAWKYLMVNTRGVFKTQSNIYDGAFFAIQLDFKYASGCPSYCIVILTRIPYLGTMNNKEQTGYQQ